MIIGYVMNSYPRISTTFIGREIAAVEAQGVKVQRYAIRHWDVPLVDQKDKDEQGITRYLLTGAKMALMGAVLREVASNPIRVLKALGLTIGLMRNAGGGVIRHIAYLVEAIALRQYAKADGVTHFHAHFSTNSATIAMLANAMGGPGYSMTVHGPDEFFTPYEISLRTKIHRSRFVAAISHFCTSQLMLFSDQAHWHKMNIIHCGVQPDHYGQKPRDAFGKRILFVGRLDAVKGGPFLLEAFAGIKPKHSDATLTVIGDGDDRPTLEAQAQSLGVSDAVDFVGFKAQEEVAAMLEEADMLVLPSFAEGVPVVLMEAMASRIPVIASQVAGVSELVRDGQVGFVVPPSDIATLTDRLDQLLSDPAMCKRMGEAGQQIVEAEFNINAEGAKLAALFRKASVAD